MTEFRPDPPEFPGGQDDGEPDLRLALRVVFLLLSDLLDHDAISSPDLRLRTRAVRNVVRRIREIHHPDAVAAEDEAAEGERLTADEEDTP